MEEPGADLVPLDHADVLVDLDLDPVASAPSYNPAIVYLSGLSPNSKRAMRAALNRVAGELVGWVGKGRDRRPRVGFDEIPWQQLRFQHVSAIRARLGERYSPSAANQSLVAIREVLKAAWKLGLEWAEHERRLYAKTARAMKRAMKPREVTP